MFELDVAFTPTALRDPGGRCIVVVDTLRATSTIATLLANGARRVYPMAQLEAAYNLREALGPGTILVGERNSVPPPGFDHGNSPAALARLRFDGRDVVLTTTNGTRCLAFVAASPVVFTAALVNATAAAREALATGLPITVVCSGEGGGTERANEDTYTAGVIAGLARKFGAALTVAAGEAVAFAARFGSADEALRAAPHGRALVAAGFVADVGFCARVDTSGVVPVVGHDSSGRPFLAPGGLADRLCHW